jgi:hypothetical protein
MHLASDAVANKLTYDPEAERLYSALNGRRDIPHPSPGTNRRNTCHQRAFSRLTKFTGRLRHRPDQNRIGIITHETVFADYHIKGHDIAILDKPIIAANAMDNLIIQRNANIPRISQTSDNIPMASTGAPMKLHEIGGGCIQLSRRNARLDERAKFG